MAFPLPRLLPSILPAFLILLACSEDSTGPAKPGGEDTTAVDTIDVDTLGGDTLFRHAASLEILGSARVRVGENLTLTAVVRDSAGAVLAEAPVLWISTDSARMPVAGGVVTPSRIGTAQIIAFTLGAFDTLDVTSYLPPYTFVFADTAPEAERDLIRDGVQDAHAFQLATFGRGLTDSTTISGVYAASGCASSGSAAFAGGRTITFCLGNQGWKAHGPVIRRKIVQHELFHLWQFKHWAANPGASAAWILEGSAELMGFRGIAGKGLIAMETALGCQVKESAEFAVNRPPGLPALSTVEGLQSFQTTVGPLYTHSMLAMQALTASSGGLASLGVYGDSLKAGAAWQASFNSAFGKTPAAFYGEFPGYLSGLTVPAAYACRI